MKLILIFLTITSFSTLAQEKRREFELSSDAKGFIEFDSSSKIMSARGLSEIKKLSAWLKKNNQNSYTVILFGLKSEPMAQSDQFLEIERCKIAMDSLLNYGIKSDFLLITRDQPRNNRIGVGFIIDSRDKEFITVDKTTSKRIKQNPKPPKKIKLKYDHLLFAKGDMSLSKASNDPMNEVSKLVSSNSNKIYSVTLQSIEMTDESNTDSFIGIKRCKIVMDKLFAINGLDRVFIRNNLTQTTGIPAVVITLEQVGSLAKQDDRYFK